MGAMFRQLSARQLTFDVTLAALCVLVRLAMGIGEPLMFLVVLLMAAALGLRRYSPALALGIAWLGAFVQLAGGLYPDISNTAILPVLFATAAYGSAMIRWFGLASAGFGTLLIAVYLSFRRQLDGNMAAPLDLVRDGLILFVFWLVVFGLSWTLGLLSRTGRQAKQGRLALALAEAEEARARHDVVVEQERNRIARDMHDVVAHSLAVVIAQADGARYVRKSDPDAVDDALVTISGTARDALGDVRLLLAQLRHNQGEGPQPVLADLDRLLDQLRSAGLTISFEELGTPLALGMAQQLAVYRIVQEALTNALRHGDTGKEVVVRLEWLPRQLRVTIDSGVETPVQFSAQPSLGHGIAGMQERALLAGGALTIEPFGHRFLVSALLPVTSGPSPSPSPSQENQ